MKDDSSAGEFSIDFLHRNVMANDRVIYAPALAAGINDFNKATIIINLLGSGALEDCVQRTEAGKLIAKALNRLGPVEQTIGRTATSVIY